MLTCATCSKPMRRTSRSLPQGKAKCRECRQPRAGRDRKDPPEATRLDDLNDMRELLWSSVREADPAKRAPLFARLESVVKQIDELAPVTAKAGDPVDEIAKRRAARGAGAASSKRRAASD